MTAATSISVDLLIVGAGPVGLFGAYYAGVRTLSTAVLDSLEEPGGQITAMYPEKAIFDVAGFPAIKGRDLVEQLVKQAAPHDPAYLLGHQAVELERGEGSFAVTTSAGLRIECRAIVITGGIGTFTPRPLPSGSDYLGRGLAHFVPDPTRYAGEDVVVVGGGDSALDWALMLEPIAKSVTIVHRRAEFRAHPHSVQLLKASSVHMITDAQISAVRGDPSVTECDVDVAGVVRTISCSRLVAALGFTANLGPLMEWGIEIRKRQIVVDAMGRTTVPGIYAAGDIVDYEGKVKLIATGFGEVATAVNNAAAYLNPKVSAFPGHLSDYAPEDGSTPHRGVMIVGVGIDVVPVERFAEAMQRTPTMAARLFTAAELRTQHGEPRTAESLAARFAAKEALAKALGAGGGMHWTDAEVRTDDAGRPSLVVTGTVAARAASLGVTRWHVSLSHDGGIASATVIAEA